MKENNFENIKELTNQLGSETNEEFNVYEIGLGEYLPYVGYNNREDSGFIKRVIDAYSQDEIYDYNRQFSEISFIYDAKSDGIVLELPLTYYKGYQGKIDGEYLELYSGEYTNNVTMNTKIGKHKYIIKYKSTILAKLSFIISLLTFIYLCLYKKLYKKCCE